MIRLDYTLLYTSLFSGIIFLILFLYKNKALRIKEPISLFIWFTIVSILWELNSAFILVNPRFGFQFYFILEVVALYYFYNRLLRSSYKNSLRIFLGLMLVAYSVSFLFWNKGGVIISDTINRITLTTFVLLFSLLWFAELFRKMEISKPWKDATFYFVSGFFIYYASTLFLFLLGDFMFSAEFYLNSWLVNLITKLLLRVLLIIGVWKLK